MIIPIKNVDVNRFWDRTPTPLKYLLIVAIIIATTYFVFMKKVYIGQTEQISQLVDNAKVTYELVDNFEKFKQTQDDYNEEFSIYLNNLYNLVQELNETTNKQFSILLGSGSNNKDEIIKTINLINESFVKLSKVYQELSTTKITTPPTLPTPPSNLEIRSIKLDEYNDKTIKQR